jgi:cytochrome b pre-mRNA-processing protein 3
MPIWPFRRSRADEDAARLLAQVMAAARQPALYGVERIADKLQGRVEAMTLFASLALIRLRAAPEAAPLAQTFTDLLFRHFDAGLREAGIGDLTVPKRMHALAGAFYGRLEAYAGTLDDPDSLAGALERNLAAPAGFAAALTQYIQAVAHAQASRPAEALLEAPAWPGFIS